MAEKICGIYKITSPTKRVYIGQSIDIKKRWTDYRRVGSIAKHTPKLYNSLKKYTPKRHKFEILARCEPHELNDLESFFVILYQSNNQKTGLNLTSGGNILTEFSKEVVEKKIKNAASRKLKSREPFTSKYIGVFYDESRCEWVARIAFNGKRYNLGRFKEEFNAAFAYDCAFSLFYKKDIGENLNKEEITNLILAEEDVYREIKVRVENYIKKRGKAKGLPVPKYTKSSKYIGVTAKPKRGICESSYYDETNNCVFLGTFKKEIDAAIAYDLHLIENNITNRQRNFTEIELKKLISNYKGRIKIKTTSKYTGINYNKQTRSWAARVTHNNKRHYLGLFKTEKEAVLAYNKFIDNNNIDKPKNTIE